MYDEGEEGCAESLDADQYSFCSDEGHSSIAMCWAKS